MQRIDIKNINKTRVFKYIANYFNVHEIPARHLAIGAMTFAFFSTAFIVSMASFRSQDSALVENIPVMFPPYHNVTYAGTVKITLLRVFPTDGTIVLEVTPEVLTGFPPQYTGRFRRIGKQFTMGIDNTEWTANVDSLPTSTSVVVRFDHGQQSDYPFDRYSASFFVWLYEGNDFIKSNLDLNVRVNHLPIPGWIFKFSHFQDTDLVGVKHLQVSLERSAVFKVYPVFIIIAMWFILIADLVIGIGLVVYQVRRVEAPLLGLLAALIFAIPALRNSVPSPPAIGCLMDYASFFWTMLVVVLVFLFTALTYIRQTPAPAGPAPAPAPAPAPSAAGTGVADSKEKEKKKEAPLSDPIDVRFSMLADDDDDHQHSPRELK